MKKSDKRDTINLFFSAFLILAFIVCAHFFSEFSATLPPTVGLLVTVLVFAVFGLLVFYATRVGDGKAVKRFSLVTLIVLVIPTLYIIVAALAPGLPLHDLFVSANGGASVIVSLAAVAFGYGVPYTFLSGFELAGDEEPEISAEDEPLEGGLEADLKDDGDDETPEADDNADADADSPAEDS